MEKLILTGPESEQAAEQLARAQAELQQAQAKLAEARHQKATLLQEKMRINRLAMRVEGKQLTFWERALLLKELFFPPRK